MATRVSCYLDSINDTSEHVLEIFHDPFTLNELNESLKPSSNTNSFHPGGFHVKNLGPNTKPFLLEIYNTYWDHAVWPWSVTNSVRQETHQRQV